MAIAKGNRTTSNLNPNGNIQTLAHTMNTGADGLLLVVITMSNSTNFSSVTFDGVAMTQVRNQNFSGLSQRQGTFYLLNPNTGNKNIAVNFSGSQFNSTSIFAQSFVGASGIGNDGNSGASTTPNSQSLTISENSIIYLTGISSNAQSFGYDIGGATVSNHFTHNTNKIVEGALSATGLSAGSQNVTTKADFGTISNYRVEILEAGATPPSRRRIFVV